MPPYLGAEPQPSTIVADRYHSSGAATSLIGLAPIRHAQARGIAAIHAFARLQPLITAETPLVQYCHTTSRQEAIALTIMNAGRLCIAIMQHGDKSGKTTEWITENTARLRHHPSSAPLRMSPRYLDVVKACREGPIVRQLFRELLQANAHHESFTKGAASPGLALHQSATIT